MPSCYGCARSTLHQGRARRPLVQCQTWRPASSSRRLSHRKYLRSSSAQWGQGPGCPRQWPGPELGPWNLQVPLEPRTFLCSLRAEPDHPDPITPRRQTPPQIQVVPRPPPSLLESCPNPIPLILHLALPCARSAKVSSHFLLWKVPRTLANPCLCLAPLFLSSRQELSQSCPSHQSPAPPWPSLGYGAPAEHTQATVTPVHLAARRGSRSPGLHSPGSSGGVSPLSLFSGVPGRVGRAHRRLVGYREGPGSSGTRIRVRIVLGPTQTVVRAFASSPQEAAAVHVPFSR